MVKSAPWWFDYSTGEIVRRKDGKRWRVEDVPEVTNHSAIHSAPINVEAIDRWVKEQPTDD